MKALRQHAIIVVLALAVFIAGAVSAWFSIDAATGEKQAAPGPPSADSIAVMMWEPGQKDQLYPGTRQSARSPVFNQQIRSTYSADVDYLYVELLSLASPDRRDFDGVGRIDFLDAEGQRGSCTAMAVSETHILTAGHCFYRTGMRWANFTSATFQLGLLGSKTAPLTLDVEIPLTPQASDASADPGKWAVVYEGTGRTDMDFAVLPFKQDEWKKAKDKGRKPVKLAGRTMRAKEELYIAHHPLGWQQVISSGPKCQVTMLPDQDVSVRFSHSCDTQPGSSGAPVFQRGYRAVVGLHVCCDLPNPGEAIGWNYAVSIEAIARRSPIIDRLVDHAPLNEEQKEAVAYAVQSGAEASPFAASNPRLALLLAAQGMQGLMVGDSYSEETAPYTRVVEGVLSRAYQRMEGMSLQVHSNNHGEIGEAGVLVPDGEKIFLAWGQRYLRSFDLATGEERFWWRMENGVYGVDAAANGRFVAWDQEELLVADGLRNQGDKLGEEDLRWAALGVKGAMISEDGRRILSWGYGSDPTQVWDASNGKLLFSLNTPRPEGAGMVSPDGTRFVTWEADGRDRKLFGWGGNGQNLFERKLACGDKDRCGGEFSKDGKAFLYWGLDEVLWLDSSTGEVLGKRRYGSGVGGARLILNKSRVVSWGSRAVCLHPLPISPDAAVCMSPPESSTGSIVDVSVSSTGTQLLARTADGGIYVWDVASRQPMTGSPLKIPNLRQAAMWGNDGQVFALDGSGVGRVLDLGTGLTLAETAPEKYRYEARVLRDGVSVLLSMVHDWTFAEAEPGAGRTDWSTWIWRPTRLPVAGQFVQSGDQDALDVAVAPAGDRFFMYRHGLAALYDANTLRLVAQTPVSGDVYEAKFSPDGATMLLTDNSRDLRLLRSSDGMLLKTWKDARDYHRSGDGSRLAFAEKDVIRIVDASSGADVQNIRLSGASGIRLSRDGRKVAALGGNTVIRIFDVETGAETGKAGIAHWFAFSPDGARVVANSSELRDTETGRVLAEYPEGPDMNREEAEFSGDGRTVYFWRDLGVIALYDARTGGHIVDLNKSSRQTTTQAAFVARDTAVVVWGAQTLQVRGFAGEELQFDIQNLSDVSVSPDSMRLLAVGSDTAVDLLDAKRGDVLAEFKHGADVEGGAFLPNGRILTWSRDGLLRSWAPPPAGSALIAESSRLVSGLAAYPGECRAHDFGSSTVCQRGRVDEIATVERY